MLFENYIGNFTEPLHASFVAFPYEKLILSRPAAIAVGDYGDVVRFVSHMVSSYYTESSMEKFHLFADPWWVNMLIFIVFYGFDGLGRQRTLEATGRWSGATYDILSK